MKIAYFSPLPPKRTGIATYSYHLARAMGALAELDFYDTPEAEAPLPERPLIDYVARPETLLEIGNYDGVLYHLGNNPEFHLEIYRALLMKPGVVVIHDAVLYFLVAGLGRGGMLREFLFEHGPGRLAEFFAIERESPDRNVLRYRQPERYPFLKRVLARAAAIVVHSETSASFIKAAGFAGPVHVVPFLAYGSMTAPTDRDARAQTRMALGLGEGELLIGSFGFIGPTKRMSKLFEALARLKERMRFKLLVVGTGPDLRPDIAAHGLGDHVILSGFVEEGQFNRLLRAIDILVNLRFPSMGESSATLIQAMACETPSIVSDSAWFAELPDDAVCKIGIGASEPEELEQALLLLAENPSRRDALGRAARAYVDRNCAPDTVAAQYLDILAAAKVLCPRAEARTDRLGAKRLPENTAAWVRAYFDRRIEQAIQA